VTRNPITATLVMRVDPSSGRGIERCISIYEAPEELRGSGTPTQNMSSLKNRSLRVPGKYPIGRSSRVARMNSAIPAELYST